MITELREYLSSLTSLPVYIEDEPTSNESEEFLLIKNTESTDDRHEYCDVIVEAFGASTFSSYELIHSVKDWMEGFTDNGEVASVQNVTIYKDNDAVKKRYRYRGTWRIHLL